MLHGRRIVSTFLIFVINDLSLQRIAIDMNGQPFKVPSRKRSVTCRRLKFVGQASRETGKTKTQTERIQAAFDAPHLTPTFTTDTKVYDEFKILLMTTLNQKLALNIKDNKQA